MAGEILKFKKDWNIFKKTLDLGELKTRNDKIKKVAILKKKREVNLAKIDENRQIEGNGKNIKRPIRRNGIIDNKLIRENNLIRIIRI